MLQTLLLNSTYDCIAFISERKVSKLISKEKVEILASWEEKLCWGRGSIRHPAVVKLKHHAPWIPRKKRFNRHGVFKRDKYICQYCGQLLTASKLTIDHVFPQSQGGDNSWKNCVTACFTCNNKKGDRTPEQANMKLLNKPYVPGLTLVYDFYSLKRKHADWPTYLGIQTAV